MKKYLILSFCLFTGMAKAQVVVDTSLQQTYKKMVQRLTLGDQKRLRDLAGHPAGWGGFAVLSMYHTDTLNKKDLLPRSKITITDIQSPSGDKLDIIPLSNPENEGSKGPVPVFAGIKGDTLIIMLPPVLAPNIVHKIVNGNIISTYEERRRRDTIFRLNTSLPKSNLLSIPAKTPVFKLSTSSYKAGEFLYGEIEYETDAYCIDDTDFKLGYINKRIRCRYVFRTGIVNLNRP